MLISQGPPQAKSTSLCRLSPLPWEADPQFFTNLLDPAASAFVADLLARNPAARKPIRTVVHSPLFEPLFMDSAFDTILASASSLSLVYSTVSHERHPSAYSAPE